MEGDEAGRFLVACLRVSVSSVVFVASDEGGHAARVPEAGDAGVASMSGVVETVACVRCGRLERCCRGGGMVKLEGSGSGSASDSSSTSVSMESGANRL